MIGTHILDTSKGVPAAGITVRLQVKQGGQWKEILAGATNSDGRFSFDCEKTAGVYRIVFEIEEYLKRETKEFFFPVAEVVFKIEDTQRKYHVPLLLNPFGYSTYRGS
jgi:5-hydroxyisourate hydrolase